MEDNMLQWHPALRGVVQRGLRKEEEGIDLRAEFGLSNMPMRIDLLVINTSHSVIDTDIGRILRGHNIFEYKGPGDSLSIDDFYKAYAYACFYKANTEHIDEIYDTDLTITLICNHYPYKMLKKLAKSRRIKPRQIAPGVYYLEGDPIPIQLIVVHQLSYKKKENLWLCSLRTDLVPGEHLNMLLEDYQKHKDSKMYQEMMDIIVRANKRTMEEARKMCNALRELWADDLEKEVAKEVAKAKLIVTRQVTEEVTQQVTQQVTQEVTQQVTQQVIHKDLLALAEMLLEEKYSEEFICKKLQEKFGASEEDAMVLIQEAAGRTVCA